MSEPRPSRGEAIVEGSLNWSFLTRSDLPELAELCAAIEYFDDPARSRSLPDLERDHDQPTAHADRHAVVGRDAGGTIVAYAWNHITASDDPAPHVWLEFGVHPAWRHHKIGLKLVGWSIDRARAWYRHIRQSHPGAGRLWVGCATDEDSRVAADLQMNGLLAPQRWFFDGHLPLIEGELRPRFVPDGLELRPYEARWMEEVRQAHNLAFRTRYGALDVGRSAWTASLTRPEFRPEWSWLAVCADAPDAGVVGYALNSEICDTETGWREGWTERLGVLPDFQHRGLGRALLVSSMHSFAAAGCALAGIGLDTDEPTRAQSLFGDLGYVFDDRMVLYGNVFED